MSVLSDQHLAHYVARDRPLIFSGSVQAILAGRKTQTRRVVTVTSRDGRHTIGDDWRFVSGRHTCTGQSDYELGRWCWQHSTDISRVLVERCPYGRAGDRLWLRENFAPVDGNGRECKPSEAAFVVLTDGAQKYRDGHYAAPLPAYAYQRGAFDGIEWRPSIQMPRWASRLTLEVTDVRVELLQAISEADALAEGVDPYECPGGPAAPWAPSAFAELWDRINAKRAPWSTNPWVWAVAFKRVEVTHG